MGISNQPTAAAVAIGKILSCVYSHLGYDSLLLCSYQELPWSDCHSLLLGSVRGRGDTGIRTANLTGMLKRPFYYFPLSYPFDTILKRAHE